MRKKIVLDTNSIMCRPQIIDMLAATCAVSIPRVVVNELNYQKDNGSPENRKNAGLCMNKIIEKKFSIVDADKKWGINDDKILACAINIATQSLDEIVYLVTNDKDFRLKDCGDVENLEIVSTSELEALINENDNTNLGKSKEFFKLVKSKDYKGVIQFNKAGVDFNLNDGETGYTPLIQAIRGKDYRMVEYLSKLSGVDLNAVDETKFKLPAISHAIQMNCFKLVKTLIEAGANVNAPSKNKTNYFNTPLMIASWHGRDEIVKLLVENGACINQQDQKNGFTSLIKAVFNGHKTIAKYLLDKGADRTIFSFEFKTALDYAEERHDKDIIQLLKTVKDDR